MIEAWKIMRPDGICYIKGNKKDALELVEGTNWLMFPLYAIEPISKAQRDEWIKAANIFAELALDSQDWLTGQRMNELAAYLEKVPTHER